MQRLLLRTMLLVCLSAGVFGQAPATTEDLVRQILAALEQKDEQALAKLSISEDEYRRYIWPAVSAGNPAARLDRFYQMYRQGSATGLAAAMKQLGGRKLQLVNITPGAPIRQTRAYRLLAGPAVSVRDSNGQETTVRLPGAVLEHEGTSKVSTYFVTPARTGGQDD
jgi:hypothetical protein